MCPIPNGFRAVSPCSFKIVVKKELLRTVSNTSIYCSGDKFGRVYNTFANVPPSTSMQFATRVKEGV
jgi:hypothetical protein